MAWGDAMGRSILQRFSERVASFFPATQLIFHANN